MVRKILALIVFTTLPGGFTYGDPPLKLIPDDFDLPKHQDPMAPSPQIKICLPCQGLRPITGYVKSSESVQAIGESLGVDFKKNEKGVMVGSPKINLHHQGVTFVVTDTVSVNVGKVGKTGTKGGNISKSVGNEKKPNDFSQQIKDFRSRDSENN